jgi:hypothetical protein
VEELERQILMGSVLIPVRMTAARKRREMRDEFMEAKGDIQWRK